MIAVKGMKMPKTCSDCDFCHGHICKRTGTDIITNPKGNCPLVEIVTCEEESSRNNSKNVPQYRIRKFMHSREMNETEITDEGYVDEIITGEEGLEDFAKTRNISIIKRDNNGHIISCSQKEYTMSGGFEGCFFEFVPEEISSICNQKLES